MDILIAVISAFVLGWHLSSLVSAQAFRQIMKDLGVSDQQLLAQVRSQNTTKDTVKELEIAVEPIKGSLYAYTVTDATFLAQGETAQELLDKLIQTLPVGTRITCAKDRGGDLLEKALKNLG